MCYLAQHLTTMNKNRKLFIIHIIIKCRVINGDKMKKIKSLIITTIFLVSLLIVINPVSAASHHVYPGDSIQTAVNNASSGDTIYVHGGDL